MNRKAYNISPHETPALQVVMRCATRDEGRQGRTKDEVAGGQLHGLVRHAHHDAHALLLQGGQKDGQGVLGTHCVYDAVQRACDLLCKQASQKSDDIIAGL